MVDLIKPSISYVFLVSYLSYKNHKGVHRYIEKVSTVKLRLFVGNSVAGLDVTRQAYMLSHAMGHFYKQRYIFCIRKHQYF